jgi:flagellar basal-body rod protein FlgB
MLIRLFDRAIAELERGVAFANQRHEVIARNIANLETPGYRARDLVFDDARQTVGQALAPDPASTRVSLRVADRHARVVFAGDGDVRADGNDVSLDRQMAKLAENTLLHNTLVQLLQSQFTTLKQAISGRV